MFDVVPNKRYQIKIEERGRVGDSAGHRFCVPP
jgi:hypothetical protein